ncbi:MAG TPA: hypothetical protein VK524_13685 [Polyangiaceae bacterium]|nr:hypothetical protein [Polyangiaceae bacterium]
MDSTDATYRSEQTPKLPPPVYLKSPEPQFEAFFGDALAFDGQAAIVASSFANVESEGGLLERAGAAYLFESANWHAPTHLRIPDPDAGDGEIEPDLLPDEAPNFLIEWPGARVALGERWVAVSLAGDDGANDTISSSGAVYVFDRRKITEPPRVVRAANADPSDLFGVGLAISGDTLVVGAPGEASALADTSSEDLTERMANNGAAKAGAVYVYTLREGGFDPVQYLKAPQPTAENFFGTSLALEGDVLAVGAPTQNFTKDGAKLDANGAVYVFRRGAEGFRLERELRPSAPARRNFFGVSVSLSKSLLAIGAPGATGCDPNHPAAAAGDLAARPGAVYVVNEQGGSWQIEGSCLSPANLQGGNGFGYSASVSEAYLLVGAPLDSTGRADVNALRLSGSAHLFARVSAGVERVNQLVKAPVIGNSDAFGYTVVAAGAGFAVGAPRESGGQTGAAADLTDDTQHWAGAAYVFKPDP